MSNSSAFYSKTIILVIMDTIEEVDEVIAAVNGISINNKNVNNGGRSGASSTASSCSIKAAMGSAHDNSNSNSNANLDDSFLEGNPPSMRGHLLRSLLHTYPHSDAKYLDARFQCEKANLARPMGLCLLADGNLVVSSTKDDQVTILSAADLSEVARVTSSPRPFRRPSDLCALPDGRFAVRDDLGLQLFDQDGLFLQSVPVAALGSRSFGLATDNRGNLYTVASDGGNVGTPSVLGIDIDTGEVSIDT